MSTNWMFAAWVVWLLGDVCVSVFAARVAYWVWNEARVDLAVADDDETIQIIGRLRCRNTGGIFAAQSVYLVTGVSMLASALFVYQADTRTERLVWSLVLFASSVLSRLAVKGILWWLSWSSRKDRLRLRAILGVGASVVNPVSAEEKCSTDDDIDPGCAAADGAG